MKQRLTLFASLFFSLLSSAAFASPDSVPRPLEKQAVFETMKEQITSAQKDAAALEQNRKRHKRDLESLRDKVVPLSRNIQDAQQKLEMLTTRILDMEQEIKVLEETMGDNRVVLSHNLSAALRMRRMPSETLFLQTATPVHTAQTALLLRETVPPLQRRLALLNTDVTRLTELRKNLLDDRHAQHETLAGLEQEQKSLAALIEKRQALYAELGDNVSAQQAKIKQLTSEAKSLEELVAKVRSENATRLAEATPLPQLKPPAPQAVPEEAARLQPVALTAPAQELRPLRAPAVIPDKRPENWPVAGQIRVRYGETDSFGSPSQGVKFETAPGALVTTPIAGTVKYSGTFKHYGRLLIIEHDDGWHSLVAGLDQIDMVVGQTLRAGEPVGRMPRVAGASGNGHNPKLYYELRRNGHPVNPAQKIKGLG